MFLLFGNKVLACDCYKILSVEESRHVFKGKVVGIKRIESPFRRYEITFKIIKRIKGDLECKRIVVNTPCLLDGCCGIDFKRRRTYDIYTYTKHENMLYTDACTLTKRVAR